MPQQRKYKRVEQTDPDLHLMLRIASRTFSTSVVPHEDGDEPMVKARVTPPWGAMDLSVMTVADIDAFRTWINETLDLARPIAERLDARAEAAFANGETGMKRLWRQAPQYVRFEPKPSNPTKSEKETSE